MKDQFLEHLLAIIKSKKDENPESFLYCYVAARGHY